MTRHRQALRNVPSSNLGENYYIFGEPFLKLEISIAMRKWNDHAFLFPFPYSNMMFTRCEIGRAAVLLRWSPPAKSNSHFMDEGFICKSSLPCHFQDCLSTGESYFQISQGQRASFLFIIIIFGWEVSKSSAVVSLDCMSFFSFPNGRE